MINEPISKLSEAACLCVARRQALPTRFTRSFETGSNIKTAVFIFFCLSAFYAVELPAGNLEDAVALKKSFRLDDAEKALLSVIAEKKAGAEHHFELGNIYYLKSDFAKATECYSKAVEIDGENADYYFALGRAQGDTALNSNVFKQIVLASKIRDAFEKAVKHNPGHPSASTALANYYFQAPGFMGGDTEKAYSLARGLAEKNVWGHFLLADFYLSEHNESAFKKELGKAREKLEADREYFLEYAKYLTSQKRFREALCKVEEILKKNPSDAGSLVAKGDILFLTGRAEDALENFRKAFVLKPGLPYLKSKIETLTR